ncbi:YhcN/YlaJ family sporulation lipoprotein [Evansella sp. AB-rgal1]|uniref:YhcN/YlaJ family sporulation lipoprotein n=1 Tax=Evansella sp. AB-rgal1 TaxID=3242696 RepID=UPI00359E672B
MRKIALSLAAAGLLFTGLAGCGDMNDNNQGQGFGANQGQPTGNAGFGTNHGQGTGTTGFGAGPEHGMGAYPDHPTDNNAGFAMDDNDGRLNNSRNYTQGRTNNQNIGGYETRNGRTGGVGQQQIDGYYDSEDGQLATRIRDRIGGNTPVIVHRNDIIIATENNGDTDNLRNRVGGLAGERNVHVVTDRNHVRNVRDMDDRLRAGEAFEEIGATFTDMLNDLGNAVQRPFERSR